MEKAQIEHFFEFAYNRQLIYHKKEVVGLPPPWTEDPILQKYKFCNVYRELDKGTRYLMDRVIRPTGLSDETRFFNIVAYRFFNRPGTFEKLFPDLLDPHHFVFTEQEQGLDKKKKEGRPLFNDAYIVSPAPFDKHYRPGDKHIQILKMLAWLSEQLTQTPFLEWIQQAKTPEESYEALKMPLTGNFLRFEIWMDLSYAQIIPFTENEFVVSGPGSAWGLRLLNEKSACRPQEAKIHPRHDVAAFKTLRDDQPLYWKQLLERTGKDWFAIAYEAAHSNAPFLSLANIEGALCEWRKYTRLNDPTAKARRRLYHY